MLNKNIIFLLMFLFLNNTVAEASLLQCAPEEFFSASAAANECDELGVGKSRRVRGYSAASGISVKDHYMQRNEANKYQVFLSINFIQGQTGKTNPADMMNKVRGCLQVATPNLRGPDGSTLQINALTPDEAQELPKKLDAVDIKIESGTRANAEMYTDELNCGEIVHEVLHLLGLCDEYKEPSLVAGNSYACRVIPEVSTIMKNPRKVFPRASPREITCKCDETCLKVPNLKDENLKKIFMAPDIYETIDVEFRTKYCSQPKLIPGVVESKDLESFPERAILLASKTENSFTVESREISVVSEKVYRSTITCTCLPGDSACLGQKKSFEAVMASPDAVRATCPSYTGLENFDVKVDTEGFRIENGALKIRKKGSGESFLYPNHWSRIMAGPCDSIASSYNECATPAYKSTDCATLNQCSDEYFLGIKK